MAIQEKKKKTPGKGGKIINNLQYPRYGNNPSVFPKINGQRRCGVYIYIYIHNGILLHHKKEEILPFATTQMDRWTKRVSC